MVCVCWLLLPWVAWAAEGPERPARLVILSIDGLRPGIYTNADGEGLRVPNLQRLRDEGAYARGVEGVWPTSTYPSHTTLITGRYPDSHGITSNRLFDRENGSQAAWHWFEKDRRGPSLIEAAQAAGGTVASIMWPVTVGGAADVRLAEIWSLDGAPILDVIARHSTPRLLERTRRRARMNLALLFRSPSNDMGIARVAATAIHDHRPALTLIHVADTDHAEHTFGPMSAEARAAFGQADRIVGLLRRAVRRAGMAETTALAVVGDHGFADCHTRVQLNTLLAKAGLGHANADGTPQPWRAMVHANGGSAELYLRDTNDVDARATAVRVLEDAAAQYAHTFRIVSRAELDALHAAPGAELGMAAQPGYRFGERWVGPLLTADSQRGGHGYHPHWDKMRTGFILQGPGVRAGAVAPLVRMVDIGPTLAALMGWDLPDAAGIPVEGFLTRTSVD